MVDRPVRLYISDQLAIEICWNTIRVYGDDEFLNYGIKAKKVVADNPAEDFGLERIRRGFLAGCGRTGYHRLYRVFRKNLGGKSQIRCADGF